MLRNIWWPPDDESKRHLLKSHLDSGRKAFRNNYVQLCSEIPQGSLEIRNYLINIYQLYFEESLMTSRWWIKKAPFEKSIGFRQKGFSKLRRVAKVWNWWRLNVLMLHLLTHLCYIRKYIHAKFENIFALHLKIHMCYI